MNTTAGQVATAIVGVLLAVGLVAAGPIPVTSDLWDVSRGAVVTGNSLLLLPSFNIRDMFGSTSGTYTDEPGNVIFADDNPPGRVHWVEWHTPAPVVLTGFNLFATGDVNVVPGRFNDPSWRSITHVTLKKGDGTVLYSGDVSQPVDAWVVLSWTFPEPVTEQYFRAEFTRYLDSGGHAGPRIIELDAMYVPEPGTVTLIGLGLIALVCVRRPRSK